MYSQLHTLQEKVKGKQAEAASDVGRKMNEASSDDETQVLPSSVSRMLPQAAHAGS